MADEEGGDPFAPLALEIEPIASCFRHLNLTAQFLSDLTATASPSPPLRMTPADSHIFFSSLPQTQPAPASAAQGGSPSPATPEPEPAPVNSHIGLGFAPGAPGTATSSKHDAARKKLGSSRKRSKGVRFRSPDSEGENVPELEPSKGVRFLSPDSAGENVPELEPTAKTPSGVPVLLISEEKEKVNLIEGLGSCDRVKKPLAFDLMKVVELFSRKVDEAEEKRIAEMDILDILAKKGIYIEPPRWHRPGGYDA